MKLPEELVLGKYYFIVFYEKGDIPVIKTLIYLGKNLEASISGEDEYYFEDIDNIFRNPKSENKKPITMDKDLILNLCDLNELIEFLEEYRKK